MRLFALVFIGSFAALLWAAWAIFRAVRRHEKRPPVTRGRSRQPLPKNTKDEDK